MEKVEKVKVYGLRDCRNIEVGQVVRQGDVYIHCVPNNHPHGEKTNNHQLAKGITLGSRHFCDDKFEVFEGTTLPDWMDRGHFLGPCIKTKANTSLISHPEHANVAVGCETYQITHQMDIRTMQRVKD